MILLDPLSARNDSVELYMFVAVVCHRIAMTCPLRLMLHLAHELGASVQQFNTTEVTNSTDTNVSQVEGIKCIQGNLLPAMLIFVQGFMCRSNECWAGHVGSYANQFALLLMKVSLFVHLLYADFRYIRVQRNGHGFSLLVL